MQKDISAYKDGFTYLASPYSHKDPSIVEARVQETMDFAAALLNSGWKVFSPILHCHELLLKHKLPGDAGFWWDFNTQFLQVCNCLTICNMEGWGTSKGIIDEIGFCKHINPKPILMAQWADLKRTQVQVILLTDGEQE